MKVEIYNKPHSRDLVYSQPLGVINAYLIPQCPYCGSWNIANYTWGIFCYNCYDSDVMLGRNLKYFTTEEII